MTGWLNWREIEKHNDWGVRDKDDATAMMWDGSAGSWEERAALEDEFNRVQAEALPLEPGDRVLDVCCGPGSLTRWIAPRVSEVTAFDFSASMLDYVREKARRFDLDNISYMQGNFHTMEPGRDGPLYDVAVTRHSPAQGDILRFSRWAVRLCCSLNLIRGPVPGGAGRPSRWIRSAKENGGELNFSARPDPRLYGLNVHFNMLYDLGANPAISYVKGQAAMRGASPEELFARLFPGADPSPEAVAGWADSPESGLERDGRLWRCTVSQTMSILSWDPGEINWNLI